MHLLSYQKKYRITFISLGRSKSKIPCIYIYSSNSLFLCSEQNKQRPFFLGLSQNLIFSLHALLPCSQKSTDKPDFMGLSQNQSCSLHVHQKCFFTLTMGQTTVDIKLYKRWTLSYTYYTEC